MKKFEEILKEKSHQNRIKRAKKTIVSSKVLSSMHRPSQTKIAQEAQLLLKVYDQKNYDSIPAYKLLSTLGLQQYTKGLIIRGYGINLSKLILLSESQKNKMYEDLKVLPGHASKLDSLIVMLGKSFEQTNLNTPLMLSQKASNNNISRNISKQNSQKISNNDEYQKQLQRIIDDYISPIEQKQKKLNIKLYDKKNRTSFNKQKNLKIKYLNTGNIDYKNIEINNDFKKKNIDKSTKSTIKKNNNNNHNNNKKNIQEQNILKKLLNNVNIDNNNYCSNKILSIDLGINKIKSLYKSYDGALMSSTIANLDIEQLVYACSGLIISLLVPIQQKIKQPFTTIHYQQIESNDINRNDSIQDEVGQILRQSFMHPMYRQQINQQIQCDEVESQGEQEQQQNNQSNEINEFENQNNNTMIKSSFLGEQSVQFGFNENPLKIFNQPYPTQIDYNIPTQDSIANFLKNIILSSKMQRQIPIIASSYLLTFLQKSKIIFTSLNYKRILMIILLLSSKIWDDESFENPSFSKTFPQYSTILLNQMQKIILKYLNYKLKLNNKQFATIYFLLRKYYNINIKSYQNKKFNLYHIFQLQNNVNKKKLYRTNYLFKRQSF